MGQAKDPKDRKVHRIEPGRRVPTPKPELQEFARRLNEALLTKSMSASDLARKTVLAPG